MERDEKPQATCATGSLRSYTQRLNERMTPEEAMTAVRRMMAAYSEFTPCSPEYLMTIAQVLLNYPYEVATEACSPIHGVPKSYRKFRPNAGQVSEWCEDATEPLFERAKLERPMLAAPKGNPEAKLKLDELLDRVAKKMGREVRDGRLMPDKATIDAENEDRAKRAAIIDRANEKIQAGWENYASRQANIKISPSLVQFIKSQNQERL